MSAEDVYRLRDEAIRDGLALAAFIAVISIVWFGAYFYYK